MGKGKERRREGEGGVAVAVVMVDRSGNNAQERRWREVVVDDPLSEMNITKMHT